ncbi:MAG TPA: STAS domain-containing protein [Nocardioides sp.]|jgi:anti-sigma B factor antagonist|nr:STAS domain-containing protein [Nocardioides sp.]
MTSPTTARSSNGRVAGRYALAGHIVVWADGEIDLATAPELRAALAEVVRVPECKVIVDLTEVTFMDSTGLNALVLGWRKAKAVNGELQLVGAGPMVRKVLRVTGLEQIFPVHSTIEECIGESRVVPHIATLAELPARARFLG